MLEDYIHIHGVTQNIRLDQVQCLIGNKFKNFVLLKFTTKKISAPAKDHVWEGLIEKLIQLVG